MVIDDSAIRLRFRALEPVLDERGRRRFAAAEALAADRGGVNAVSRATGIARSTISRGLAELSDETVPATPAGRVRRMGGGRKPLVATDATLLGDLQALVEPATRGDRPRIGRGGGDGDSGDRRESEARASDGAGRIPPGETFGGLPVLSRRRGGPLLRHLRAWWTAFTVGLR